MTDVGPSCEPFGPAGWVQPVSAWTSLAFVVAGLAILGVVLWERRRSPADPSASDDVVVPNATALRVILAVLAIGNGIGSVIQHGPEPWWNPVVHDPPLMGALALLAADAVADLTGRRLRHWWWLAPTALTAVLALWEPDASTAAQSVVAVVSVGLTLLRAGARPALRPRIIAALALLGGGGIVGAVSRPGGPWCVPGSWWFDSGWSGHAVWHILAAAALVVLAPLLGRRRPTRSAERTA